MLFSCVFFVVCAGLTTTARAQDDSYDPFADYSEFDESSEEEEDVHFLKNGRLLNVGFLGGYRGWTQNLSQVYSGNMTFGLFLTYFFDLQFALQMGFLTSDHVFSVTSSNGAFTPLRGTLNMNDLNVNIKYYLNTQNVTRGLADLNPYLVTGFSQVYRTITVSGQTPFAKDTALGFNIGAGIEIPFMRNKMYFGAQALYQYLMFTDENKIILDGNGVETGRTANGDSYSVLGVLGVNF